METDYIRSLSCNYERILLGKKPEERKYQYCMLNRGGIKGILSCSLRYINGVAYLYYDITSKQNIAQLFGKKVIDRNWFLDFMWSMQYVREELQRYLLDERNLLWFPQHIYQDPENNNFSFMYMPYCEEETGFGKMLEFIVEHVDYEDELLVECVYKVYEKYESNGEVYLHDRIYKDVECLSVTEEAESTELPEYVKERDEIIYTESEEEDVVTTAKGEKRKGLRFLFGARKRKDKEEKEQYRSRMRLEMSGYAVAEAERYGEEEDAEENDEEWGRTIFVDAVSSKEKVKHSLYTEEGRLLAELEQKAVLIGKKKEEVDIVLEDLSVSRIHARIFYGEERYYVEDLNSTNGTYKNGLRMQPYERRVLEVGDEISIGQKIIIYR